MLVVTAEWPFGRAGVGARQCRQEHPDAGDDGRSAISPLALAINIVMRVYLQRDLWAKVLETVEVHNIGAAADVRGSGELASALGEGFADGLDVAGF